VLVKGNNLPVTVEPYAELEVAPDLKISLNPDNKLLIAGNVNVPKGEITVRELPPSTVKVSDDTVIVGQPADEAAADGQVAMDINVVVGQELLNFSGFRPERRSGRARCISATTWTPVASCASTTAATGPMARSWMCAGRACCSPGRWTSHTWISKPSARPMT
jgi:hypothetical protein